MRELETASMELGKIVYEAAAQSAPKGAPGAEPKDGPSGDNNDDVVDAEFKVKD